MALIAFAGSFAILANALRAMALIAFPIITHTRASLGPDHFILGWLLYLFALIAIVVIGRRFADAPRQFQSPISTQPINLPVITAVLAIAAAASAYAHLVVLRPIERTLPSQITLFNAPGWRILPPPQNWRPNFQNPDRFSAATYDQSGNRVYVAFADYAYDRRNAEIASTANHAWNDDAWDKAGAFNGVAYLFGGSEKRNFDLLAGPENRRLLTLTAYWLGNEFFDNPRSIKLAQAKLKLIGRNPPGGVIIIAASYQNDPSEALMLIRQYTSDIESFADWRARMGGA